MEPEVFNGAVTERLTCQSRVLALDETTRRVKHVISTGLIDRANRMVEPSGWKLARFRDNPVVLADHDYAIERIIGRAYETKVEGDSLVSTTEFASEGLGNVAFRLVQAGIVNAWSVGWVGVKSHAIGEVDDCEACAAAMKKAKINYGTHYLQQELLEYSLVAIPANPEAVMGLRVAGLVGSSEAEEWIGSSLDAPKDDASVIQIAGTSPLERSADFYRSLFEASRSIARTAAMRRSASHMRGNHE